MATTLTVLAGCATEHQELVLNEPSAVEVALARGRFDLNCPDAIATVLSSDFIQPAIQGPWVTGINRAEYTIGVEGCGNRSSYIVICRMDGTETCFAANPNNN